MPTRNRCIHDGIARGRTLTGIGPDNDRLVEAGAMRAVRIPIADDFLAAGSSPDHGVDCSLAECGYFSGR
jgi:hypothetical protein